MSELAVFKFEDALPVRITDRDGSPWFVAKDICSALELSNVSEALRALDDDEKDGFRISDSIGRMQKTPIISESGMYALVIRSNKPAAKAFRKWITSEVLPNLRRDGSYSLPGQTPETVESAPAPLRKVEPEKQETPSLFPEQKCPVPEEVRMGFGHWMNWNGKRIICTTSIAAILGLSRPQVEGVFWGNRTRFIINEDYFPRGAVRFRDLTVADSNYQPCINARIAGNSRFFTLGGLVKLVNFGRKAWHLSEPNRRALPPPKPESNLPARVEKRSGEAVEREVCAILATVNRKLSGGGSLDPAVLDFAGKLAAMAYRK